MSFHLVGVILGYGWTDYVYVSFSGIKFLLLYRLCNLIFIPLPVRGLRA